MDVWVLLMARMWVLLLDSKQVLLGGQLSSSVGHTAR